MSRGRGRGKDWGACRGNYILFISGRHFSRNWQSSRNATVVVVSIAVVHVVGVAACVATVVVAAVVVCCCCLSLFCLNSLCST